MTNFEFEQMTDNAKSFTAQLLKFAAFAELDAEKVIRKTIIDLFSHIAEATPVDTGRARANWNLDFNGDANDLIEEVQGKSNANKIISGKVAEFRYQITQGYVYIYNNLEYIEALENGWSDQAPEGMVAVTLAVFEQFLEQNIKGASVIE